MKVFKSITLLSLMFFASYSHASTLFMGYWKVSGSSKISNITRNPTELTFADKTVIKFDIEHGECGKSDGVESDCDNDRQRVELKDGYRTSLQTWGNDKNIQRYYRTNLYIPKDQFPDLGPTKQMIHQKSLKGKNNPIWQVSFKNGKLIITTDSAGKCSIDSNKIPRDEWLEIEIHANYNLYTEEQKDSVLEALLKKYKSDSLDIDPSFRYFINGVEHCRLWDPLITKAGLRDGSKKQLQMKFGIYNTYLSKWLLAQPENQKWVRENNIQFEPYQQNSLGQRNGAVSSAMASPFDYDWPKKLPRQTLYYTLWTIKKDLNDLPDSRFKKQFINEQQLPGCTDPVFAKMLGDMCAAK